MLSTVAIAVFIFGLVFGWKLRGFWDRRPRIMRWGQKKRPDAAPGAAPPTEEKGGLVDKASRTGEKIIGKGFELIFGKPKGPKDDKEKP